VDVYIDRLLQLDRTQKILLALQDKDSLLQYLADIPVGLMPKVLAFSVLAFPLDLFVSRHINLSILYSTMRWWKMPMLYSYYCCVKTDTKRKRGI
jgi:hypothetical protein